MNRIMLDELAAQARQELEVQEQAAVQAVETVAARQENRTKAGLVGQMIGTALTGVGLLAAVRFAAEQIMYVPYGNFLLIAAVVAVLAMCGGLIYRQVSIMGYYKNIFDAAAETAHIRDGLKQRQAQLSQRLFAAKESADEGWKMELTLPGDVSARLRELTDSVTAKAELKTERIGLMLKVLLYVTVGICGAYGILASYAPMLGLVWSVVADVVNDYEIADLVRYVVPAACIIALGLQFWLAYLFLKWEVEDFPWYTPLVLLGGTAAAWVVCVVLVIVAVIIVFAIALIGIIIAIMVGGSILLGLFGGG